MLSPHSVGRAVQRGCHDASHGHVSEECLISEAAADSSLGAAAKESRPVRGDVAGGAGPGFLRAAVCYP